MWLRSLKGADPCCWKANESKDEKESIKTLKAHRKFEVRLNLTFNIWEMRLLQLLFDMWLVRQYLFFKSAQQSSFVFVTQHDTSSISWEWIAWQVVAFYVTSPNKETCVMRNYPVFLFVCLFCVRVCVCVHSNYHCKGRTNPEFDWFHFVMSSVIGLEISSYLVSTNHMQN